MLSLFKVRRELAEPEKAGFSQTQQISAGLATGGLLRWDNGKPLREHTSAERTHPKQESQKGVRAAAFAVAECQEQLTSQALPQPCKGATAVKGKHLPRWGL